MDSHMTAEDVVREFPTALERGDIYPCYQPQYNHATGRMIGAEALMRWEHPEIGMLLPADFLPTLEETGLIVQADLAIFEQICLFQAERIKADLLTVPISFNVSRIDLASSDYLSQLETIRKRHDVPVNLLRAEITESSAIGGLHLVANAIDRLHEYGYIVEMDDFGNGYSSLNILKDLQFDIIKFDMVFLRGDLNGRGGTIVSAMMQMAKWLGTPVIAEGVETLEQADFMKSIGCSYLQGFLYAKPLTASELSELLQRTGLEPTLPSMEFIDTLDSNRFWDPTSLETLIFSNYVGAAAIFSYENGETNILRVNPKYTQELGMNLTEQDVVHGTLWNNIDEENLAVYRKAIERAIETGEEQTCETWRTITSDCCGEDRICIQSTLRAIGRAGNQSIIYAMIRNITAEKKRYAEVADSERRFRFASEQANVYAWEYTIGTKQMRPCFRCMRDLGLPPLLENYPEPAIEAGIFPPDYADMYRDWHRQLEAGMDHLEAIIPLTVGRVPFHVRYTTEFDENGRPLKAYGSATLVVDDEEAEQE